MSIKTEPVVVGGTIAAAIAAADPILQALHVKGSTVQTVAYTGAMAIITIAVFVRQFVSPTSRLGKDVAKVEAVVERLAEPASPATDPVPNTPTTEVASNG